MEPGAASMQAVLLSPEIGIVVVIRITSGASEGKPTEWNGRKAAVLKALWRVDGTPPGLRAGHVYKGITRELGRACCFHA